jgi:hypothetical protein
MNYLTMIFAAAAAVLLVAIARSLLRRGLVATLPTAVFGLTVAMAGAACAGLQRADQTRALEAAAAAVFGVVALLVHRRRQTLAR